MKKLVSLLLTAALAFSLTAPALAAGPTFRDVPEEHWGYKYIEAAYEEGWVDGMGNGLYCPEEKISYAQFITMVARIFYADEVARSAERDEWWSPYVDVGIETFAYDTGWQSSISGMASVTGELYANGVVNQPVTRLDMAYMLYNVVEEKAPERLPSEAECRRAAQNVPDFDQYDGHWQDHLAGVVAMKLINGVDSIGTFAGLQNMTRAQAAAVLCRLVDYLGETGTGPEETMPPEESQTPEETTPPEETEQPEEPEMSIAAWEEEVFDLVNDIRAEHGLPAYKDDDTLADVARAHSQDMIDRSFFDHTNPDGELPWDRVSDAGIRWYAVAENIAAGQSTPEAVVEAWMNSPGHRANILGDCKYLGVGLAFGGGYGIYWTQCFASY